MAEDTIKGKVLGDGTVRWETPDLHGVNHTSADAMLKGIRSSLGGESRVVGRGEHKHGHTHHQQHKEHKH